MDDQVVSGFSLTSNWLIGASFVGLFSRERKKAKPRQSRITFDTYLEIALKDRLNLH